MFYILDYIISLLQKPEGITFFIGILYIQDIKYKISCESKSFRDINALHPFKPTMISHAYMNI